MFACSTLSGGRGKKDFPQSWLFVLWFAHAAKIQQRTPAYPRLSGPADPPSDAFSLSFRPCCHLGMKATPTPVCPFQAGGGERAAAVRLRLPLTDAHCSAEGRAPQDQKHHKAQSFHQILGRNGPGSFCFAQINLPAFVERLRLRFLSPLCICVMFYLEQQQCCSSAVIRQLKLNFPCGHEYTVPIKKTFIPEGGSIVCFLRHYGLKKMSPLKKNKLSSSLNSPLGLRLFH